jgi:apolipoprotein N-acyltransferase
VLRGIERAGERPPKVDMVHGKPPTVSNGTSAADWLWLAVATPLLLFANGRYALGLAAWLAPIFLVRFVRTRPAGSGLPAAYAALSVAWAFQFRGMAPLPPFGFAALALGFGAVGLIPMLVDRLVAARVRAFVSTLALPSAWASIDFLVTRFSPYGSWGSPAYSQTEQLALLQLLSVTGLYGLTFLMGWFAATVNWVWERQFDWSVTRRGALAFAVVLSVVVLGGELRLRIARPSAPTVRVASLSAPDLELFPSAEVAHRARSGEKLSDGEVAAIRARGEAIDDDLLGRSKREADAGAKVVFWAETSGFAFKEDEPALIARGSDLARAEGIYLGMAYAAWTRGAQRPLENTLVVIDPRGQIAWRFLKAIPVPGPEAAISAPGNRKLKVVATPYGRLSGVICFDMDFPAFLAQAGNLGVDVLMVPSGDWREIDPFHTDMARYRAIEQGFNMIRQVNRGLSVAVDDQGRVLASMDHFATVQRDLVAQVPIRGVRTVYSRVGDVFAWACIAGALVLVGVAASRRRRRHAEVRS